MLLIRIVYTHKEFADKKDVYFVNIKLTSGGPTVFHRGAYTDQYINFTSFYKLRKLFAVGRLSITKLTTFVEIESYCRKELIPYVNLCPGTGYLNV